MNKQPQPRMPLGGVVLVKAGPLRRCGRAHSCNQDRLLTARLLVCLCLWAGLALAFQAHGKENETLSSIIMRVTGHAETSTNCQQWRALKQGEVLLPGSVVKTTTNCLVDLWLGGKPEPLRRPKGTSSRRFYVPEARYLLRILENSVVGIDRVAGEQMSGRTNRLQAIQLDLRAGSIAGSFPKGAGETQGLIRFTNGVSRVEYGLFTLSAAGGMEVWRGKAVVSVAGRNSSREVTGCHRFDPLADVITELPDPGHLEPPVVSIELPQPPQPPSRGPEPARKF